MKHTLVVQITSVWPGILGGAVFHGRVNTSGSVVKFRADCRNIYRSPKVGEFWEVEGSYQKSEKYGKQLIVSSAKLSELPTFMAVKSLLERHPSFRGFYLGKAKIKKLLISAGPDMLVEMLNRKNTKDLSDVISIDIAEKLVDAWASLKNEVDTINFLAEHKFDPALSSKMMSLCKTNTVERLKKNPYSLICFGAISRNIWKTVDKCARKLAIRKDDSRRLIGAVEHVLYSRLRQGHTAIIKGELLQLLGLILRSSDLAERAIIEALKGKAVCAFEREGMHHIQAIGPASIELSIERRLECLMNWEMQHSIFEENLESFSKLTRFYAEDHYEQHGYTLTDKQQQAVIQALSHRCSVISGFGGTGKTTILKAVVDLSHQLHRTVYLMALSGKAKERMSNATGHDATTIHTFIQSVKKGSISLSGTSDPLIIIDEASMVDIATFNKLLSLFDDKPYSLLTVGDTAQLPPIGFGLVWHLMADSTDIKTTHLTEVHRTNNNSLHEAAMNIRKGQQLKLDNWNGEDEGIYIVDTNGDKLMHTVIELKKSLANAQILTPHMSLKAKDSGHIINSNLQHHLNPALEGTQGIRIGKHSIHVNDPVIVTENSYEVGLFNGMTGTLTSVLTKSDGKVIGIFKFDDETDPKELSLEQMYDVGIQLAYAVTVHKSQGSEYDSVIACVISDTPFVERSLIYTAVTRAKKLCLIAGTNKKLNAAISRPPHASTLYVGLHI